MAKHGAPRTCFACRAGLRHMLVILNIRHEDSLFSKINVFASLTSVDARKTGKRNSAIRGVPARSKPPGILRHMLVILNIRHEDSLLSKINVFASLDSGRAGVRATRGAEDGSLPESTVENMTSRLSVRRDRDHVVPYLRASPEAYPRECLRRHVLLGEAMIHPAELEARHRACRWTSGELTIGSPPKQVGRRPCRDPNAAAAVATREGRYC